jgi:hypothetical protein
MSEQQSENVRNELDLSGVDPDPVAEAHTGHDDSNATGGDSPDE